VLRDFVPCAVVCIKLRIESGYFEFPQGVNLLYINHKSLIIHASILAALLMVSVLDAEAGNRFGMGRSIGRAPVSNAPHPSNPSRANEGAGAVVPNTPIAQKGAVQNGASQNAPTSASGAPGTPVTPVTPVQMQQSPSQRSFMGTVIGGVATGLGISWLMHSMGLGSQGWGGSGLDEIFGVVLLLLLGIAVVLLVRAKLTRHNSADIRNYSNSSSRRDATGSPSNPVQYSNYKSKNVGNDSSARPWEAAGADSVSGYSNDSMPHYSGVPAGFDVKAFVDTAKQVFMTLQEAWDRSDMRTLHSMLTDQMLSEIKTQLNERERHASGISNQTDVVTLQAELLGIDESQTEYTASVEFSGLIREDPTQGPSPFREVWSLCRPKDGVTGWLVSGVQALE